MYFKQTDDYLDETKPELVYLDLSESLILTKEDLEKTISRIPNLKLKSDPIEDTLEHSLSQESIKLNSFYSNSSKSVTKNPNANKLHSKRSILAPDIHSDQYLKYSFVNPIPESMMSLDLNDFCETEIDWKMLTLLRPKTKQEEEFFAKLVELYQLRHKTRIEDGFGQREAVFRLSRHPRVMQYKATDIARIDSSFGFRTNDNSNRIEEDFTYESFTRTSIENQTNQLSDDCVVAIEDILSLGDSLDFKLFEN